MSIEDEIVRAVRQGVEEAMRPLIPRLLQAPHRLSYTIAESAEILGVSEMTVRRMVQAGVLPKVQGMSKRVVIPRAALERMVEDTSVDGSSPR